MAHIVLLGDSIFDNAAYVPGGPDVVRQLRELLPQGSSATLLAVDGALTRGVPGQMTRLPKDATYLVLSVGGNDALGESHVLGAGVRNVAEAVAMLAAAQERFARDYEEAVEALLEAGLPTAVCTIYDTPQSSPDRRIIRSALALFNDMITRSAFSRGLPLVDLRLICNEDADYANPIEPSIQGGAKMAAAMVRLVFESGASPAHSLVIAR